MGSTQNERFSVRLPGGERQVEGIEGLLELVRSEGLSPTTRVRREGEEAWVHADRIPALRLHFSTDSWDGLDGITIEQEAETEEMTEIADLPSDAIEVLAEPGEFVGDEASIEELPSDALAPLDTPQMVVHSENKNKRRRRGLGAKSKNAERSARDTSAGPSSGKSRGSGTAPEAVSTSGELIEFPAGYGIEPDAADENSAVVRALKRLDEGRTPSATKPKVRWLSIAVFGVLFVGGAKLFDWYLRTNATEIYDEVPADPQFLEEREETVTTDLMVMELELRNLLAAREDRRDLSRGPQVTELDQVSRIEDLIEEDLQFRMRILGGVDVTASVLEVRPGAYRLPLKLELELSITSSAEDEQRILGSIGLVLGRLVTDHDLEEVRSARDATHFLVTMRRPGNGTEVLQFAISDDDARQFYRQRDGQRAGITLEEFLRRVERIGGA